MEENGNISPTIWSTITRALWTRHNPLTRQIFLYLGHEVLFIIWSICMFNLFAVRSSESWKNIKKNSLAGVESANVKRKRGSVLQLVLQNWYGTLEIEGTKLLGDSIFCYCWLISWVLILQELFKRLQKSTSWACFTCKLYTFEVVNEQNLILTNTWEHFLLVIYIKFA